MRRPDAVLNAQPWAEDGRLLLQGAIYHSWDALSFHVVDYLFIIPVIVATLSLYAVGLTHAPLLMNLTAILIPVLIGVYFASKQFRFIIKNDLLRGFCSLFIVLIPGKFMFEPYHNITNIQSFIPIFVVLFVSYLLFRYDDFKQKSIFEKSIFAVILSLIFLTGPVSHVMLPFFLFVIFRELKNSRKIKTIIPIIIPTIVLISHMIFFIFNRTSSENTLALNQGELQLNSIFIAFTNMFTIITTQLFYHPYLQFNNYFGSLAYIIPITIVFFILYKIIKNKSKLDLFLLFSFLVFPLAYVITRPFLLDNFSDLFSNRTNARYFVIPMIFVLISLVRQFNSTKSRIMILVFFIFLIIIIINVISGFEIREMTDLDWKTTSKIFVPGGNSTCSIPINPGRSMDVLC